ncbi:hypothetical protein LCGC14_2459480, partial [marine sediment metagenome]
TWRHLVEKALKGADFDKRLVAHTADGLRIEPLYTRADRLKGADTAMWLLGQAVSIKPLFTDAYLLTGNLLSDQGKTDEAAEAYRRAVEADPESAKAHSSLGNAERALGRPEAAEAAYKRAIELKPDSAEAHFNLASLYGKQGRYQETIEEAVLAGDLIKLVEVFCRAGWCRQDIVHYLISTLIDDYTDPIVKDQVDQLTCWDPTMHMDS